MKKPHQLWSLLCIAALFGTAAPTFGQALPVAKAPALPTLMDYMCGAEAAQRLGAAQVIVAKPSPYSSKLVVFPYHKDAIYPVNVFFNRFTHFEFDAGEKLVGMYISDETEFERFVAVTGRDAMVRPRVRGVSGAATIITDKRRYQIELRDVSVCPAENQYQRVSWLTDQGIFEDASALSGANREGDQSIDKVGEKPTDKAGRRPGAAVASTPATVPRSDQAAEFGMVNLGKLSTDYIIEGAPEIKPVMVMDDGERTFLKFGDTMTLRPAMFAVTKDGEPQIVEYAAQGAYFVAGRIFEHGILLKHDKSEVKILSRRAKCGFWDANCRKVDTQAIVGF